MQVEYPGRVTGLHDVSLRIQKGEFVFFVGRTGAGKSTLIKLVTSEVRPTHGSVFLQGRDLTHTKERDVPSLRREMGIVPQDFALLPRKRVWENVAYAMRAVGHSRAEVRRKVPAILDHVNIGHRADAFPHQLSGGEQQRVAIARALINNPPLLIADEPTGNLDPDHSWEIMELLKSLNLKGTTVLVASHDMMVIHRMERRIVTMEGGRVVQDSHPDAEPIKSAVHVTPGIAFGTSVEAPLTEVVPIEAPSMGIEEVIGFVGEPVEVVSDLEAEEPSEVVLESTQSQPTEEATQTVEEATDDVSEFSDEPSVTPEHTIVPIDLEQVLSSVIESEAAEGIEPGEAPHA